MTKGLLRPPMSSRDRRALAVGATSLLLIIGLARVVPAERRWRARTELRATLLAREVAAARTLVAGEKATRDSLAARARVLHLSDARLMHADNTSAGEAALAALVGTAARSSNIKVDALALDANGGDGGSIRTVAVTGGATGDIQGIARFVAAIERAPARLAVRALSITSSDVAAPDTRAETLRLEFTVEAQILAAAPRIR